MSTAHVTPDSSATPTSRELSLVKNNAGTKGVSPSKSCFKPAATVFTQIGPEGIRFDFNDGCRVSVPIGDWRVRIRDFVTGNMLFETSTMVGSVFSSKKFYVPFEVEVWQGEASVFKHRLDLKDKNVLIQFPVGTLGDLVAWFPYAPIFAEKNQCNLTCAMGQRMIDLLGPADHCLHRLGELPGVGCGVVQPLLGLDDPRGRDQLLGARDLGGGLHRPDPLPDRAKLSSHA